MVMWIKVASKNFSKRKTWQITKNEKTRLSISNEQVSVTVGSLTAANDRCGSKPGEEGQTVEAEQVFIHPRCVPPECQINYFD